MRAVKNIKKTELVRKRKQNTMVRAVKKYKLKQVLARKQKPEIYAESIKATKAFDSAENNE